MQSTSAMRIALVADVFPPLRSSGAVQLRDLSLEFVRQGHKVTVLTPASDLQTRYAIETWNGVRVCRLRAPRTKDIGFIARTLGEIAMPHAMLRSLARSPLASERWDGVVWYSPTIFLGPVAREIKSRSACPGYLIVRDIFPEWAVDMGLMKRGLPYDYFKSVEYAQYRVADVIGVQSATNLPYFRRWSQQGARRVEVLQNWLADAPDLGCSIRLSETALAGRKVLVYAGNMGVAQGLDLLLGVAGRLKSRSDIGFALVGRGSEKSRLQRIAQEQDLHNVIFFDEIEPAEISGLYRQCDIGLVMLDPRHTTNNIPGKFLSYMHAGLPVLASINPGNELAELIEAEGVGRATMSPSPDALAQLVGGLLAQIECDKDIGMRCRTLGKRMFSPTTAVEQIVSGLRAATNKIECAP